MGNGRSTSFDSGLNLRFGGSVHRLDSRRLSSGPVGGKRRRCLSSDSLESSNTDYGWFEDFESPALHKGLSSSDQFPQQPIQKALTLPPPVAEVPLYVLESSLETQQLWYKTAGRRPRQPSQEREYFEKLWSKNIEDSAVPLEAYYNGPNENVVPSNMSSSSAYMRSQGTYEVIYRGAASFSYSVNKSFPDTAISAITIQMPYYRICRDDSGHVFAQFLVVVSLGGHGAVTFGIWKRYSEFQQLARRITEVNLRVGGDLFKNTLLSWQCVLQRKRWIKSLDKEYLSVKCFLIGRFIHDLLFESPNPTLISTFLGLE